MARVMKKPILDEAELVRRFENQDLEKSEWDHEAHVRVALFYVRTFSLEDAIERLRTGIERLNRSHANFKAYHETVTVAMATLLAHCVKRSPGGRSLAAFKAEHPDLFSWTPPILFRHYSRELLGSERARKNFLPPDKKPLPDAR